MAAQALVSSPRDGVERPRLEVADIFREFGAGFRTKHRVTPQQAKVMRAIEACRTAALGGHLDVCEGCGDSRPSYNSCRNRHCPKCQALRQAKWIAERQARVLPTHHFHVVFTVPDSLHSLARQNRARFFDLLFATASQTLLELAADPKRLGGQLGITAVLHTWTRDLRFHPHLHCVVTGGGLSIDGQRWVATRRSYLFPVQVLSKLFRGKFVAGLSEAWAKGLLTAADLQEPGAFGRLKADLFRKNWVVYAKTPFAGPAQVFSYLGRYTHRVAISNPRLLALDASGVRFVTRGGRTAILTPDVFIGRFLQHVLPDHFVKIRHFGLLAAGNVNTKLPAARRLLEPPRPWPPNLLLLLTLWALLYPLSHDSPPTATALGWRDRLFLLTGIDPQRCRRCGGRLIQRPLPLPAVRDSS